MDPQEDRDFRFELEQGLHQMFGSTLVSYELKQDDSYGTAFILGGPGKSSGMIQQIGPVSYLLSVQVHINVSDYLKDSVQITRESINLGEYGPVSMHQSQDYPVGKVVMRLDYSTTDLKGFIKALKNKAWGSYERDFTKQLEDAIED